MKFSKLSTVVLAVAGSIAVASIASYAAGLFPDFPIVGGASYCAGNTQSATGTYTGTQTGCPNTVPAGPTTATGAETFFAQTNLTNGQNPANVMFKASNFSIGARVFATSPATATIAAATPWYFLNGTQGSAFTITMPAAPTDGHIQHIVCTAATVGTLTVAANSNQTLKNNPNAACVAGVGYAWIYNAADTTWYRYQ